VRQHGAQKVEASKASSLGFEASTSGAGFEQVLFSARPVKFPPMQGLFHWGVSLSALLNGFWFRWRSWHQKSKRK
jgi:hypothetical protein